MHVQVEIKGVKSRKLQRVREGLQGEGWERQQKKWTTGMEEDEGAASEDTLRRQRERKGSQREIGIKPRMETNSFTSLPFKLTSFQSYS